MNTAGTAVCCGPWHTQCHEHGIACVAVPGVWHCPPTLTRSSLQAHEWISKHKSIAGVMKAVDTAKHPPPDPFNHEEIHAFFHEPEITQVSELQEKGLLMWKTPDFEGMRKFLVEDKQFNPERIENVIKRLQKTQGINTQVDEHELALHGVAKLCSSSWPLPTLLAYAASISVPTLLAYAASISVASTTVLKPASLHRATIKHSFVISHPTPDPHTLSSSCAPTCLVNLTPSPLSNPGAPRQFLCQKGSACWRQTPRARCEGQGREEGENGWQGSTWETKGQVEGQAGSKGK